MDIRFVWYLEFKKSVKADSLMTVAKELPKYKLYLVGVKEVRYDRGGTNQQANLNFSMERGMRIMD
jgi:hypothetical protein